MIDIHTHILHGVDDGCKTLNESISMLKSAVEGGVTEIFLTPHYRPTKGYVASCETIQKKFKELQKEVSKLRLPIKLFLGREIDEMENLDQFIKGSKCNTMNNSNYVLIDFGVREADIDEVVYELSLSGYKVIIAHIERYKYIKDFKVFDSLKKKGALFQVNVSSIYNPKNRETKRKVQYLKRKGFIDFISSDSHRNGEVFKTLKKIKMRLSLSEIFIEEVVTNYEDEEQ